MIRTFVDLLRMIKFSHTVFALPFALMGAVLAARGLPSGHVLFWILMAMIGARTLAMTFNRLVDRKIDAANPRTADREMPRGIVTLPQAVWMIVGSLLLFVFACARLNPLCLMLSPFALLVILGYSFTKRFTAYSHLVLGLSLAIAPVGAWIAVRGNLELPVLLIGLAVFFWVAGFDILYAIQDIDFDRKAGLYSLPGRVGVGSSLVIARIFHLLTVVLLTLEIPMLSLGIYYLAGLAIVSGLLFYEHAIIREDDLSRLDMAFFKMNGYISVTLFAFTLLDLWL
ncbi:MAG: UbiA family prenyltransferase [Deltaproteobacteria bacterium]|nr:UbiA family prenyltransferase [Deltaproteobacteria bacterium]